MCAAVCPPERLFACVPLAVQSEAEYGDDVMGRSLGTLGQSGSGKLRLVKKEKKVAKRLKAISAGTSGATGGFSSSLAFTPVQVGTQLLCSQLRVVLLWWFNRVCVVPCVAVVVGVAGASTALVHSCRGSRALCSHCMPVPV